MKHRQNHVRHPLDYVAIWIHGLLKDSYTLKPRDEDDSFQRFEDEPLAKFFNNLGDPNMELDVWPRPPLKPWVYQTRILLWEEPTPVPTRNLPTIAGPSSSSAFAGVPPTATHPGSTKRHPSGSPTAEVREPKRQQFGPPHGGPSSA